MSVSRAGGEGFGLGRVLTSISACEVQEPSPPGLVPAGLQQIHLWGSLQRGSPALLGMLLSWSLT